MTRSQVDTAITGLANNLSALAQDVGRWKTDVCSRMANIDQYNRMLAAFQQAQGFTGVDRGGNPWFDLREEIRRVDNDLAERITTRFRELERAQADLSLKIDRLQGQEEDRLGCDRVTSDSIAAVARSITELSARFEGFIAGFQAGLKAGPGKQ